MFEKSANIINRGNVPLYGVDIRQIGFGAVRSVETFEGVTIASGETTTVPLDSELTVGDTTIVIPIILGESTGETKAYTCEDIYGITTTVV